jgi:hypothetical protein
MSFLFFNTLRYLLCRSESGRIGNILPDPDRIKNLGTNPDPGPRTDPLFDKKICKFFANYTL